jgi:hypothetical protein
MRHHQDTARHQLTDMLTASLTEALIHTVNLMVVPDQQAPAIVDRILRKAPQAT